MKSWADAHSLDVKFVRESSRLPEVTKLIAAHRLRLARRAAARPKKFPAPAIELLARLTPSNPSAAAKFRAELALLRRQIGESRRSKTAKRITDVETGTRRQENPADGQ